MQTLILSLHVLVCVLLVIFVLLQAGKEGMGVIFGGGNSSVFGSSGAGGLLAKVTAFLAVLFVITALSYNYATSSHPDVESVILDVQLEENPKNTPPATNASATPAKEASPVAPQEGSKEIAEEKAVPAEKATTEQATEKAEPDKQKPAEKKPEKK